MIKRGESVNKLEEMYILQKELVYLSFFISKEGLNMVSEVRDILYWKTPKCTFDVIIFHGIVSFYWKLIWNSNHICAPLTECMKKCMFQWIIEAMKYFEELKKNMIE